MYLYRFPEHIIPPDLKRSIKDGNDFINKLKKLKEKERVWEEGIEKMNLAFPHEEEKPIATPLLKVNIFHLEVSYKIKCFLCFLIYYTFADKAF